MTSAYGVLANEGVRQPYTTILKITDKNGNILKQYKPQPGERVLPKNTALELSNVLSDNIARTPEFGAKSPLYFPGYDVADKTGTTNKSVDAWTIGYTPDVVVGAWAGNNDSTPMAKKIAGYIVAPMWHGIMAEALKLFPNDPFPKPENTIVLFKPVLRGKWQGGISSVTPNNITNNTSFNNETLSGGVHSILQWVIKNNPQGPYPSNPSNDPQYHLWEYSVRQWAQNHGYSSGSAAAVVTTPSLVKLISPTSLRVYQSNEDITAAFNYSGSGKISSASYSINGTPYKTIISSPFSTSFILGSTSSVTTGVNTLSVVVKDEQGNTYQDQVFFTLQ